MDAATFRQNFPEFADTAKYPDTQVNLWLGIAASRVNPSAWGDLTDLGLQLFTAHNLVFAARRKKASDFGGAPGATQGVLTAKAVDKVSSSYDAASVTNEGAGNWNATDYGTQFWDYAQMMGSGGLQL